MHQLRTLLCAVLTGLLLAACGGGGGGGSATTATAQPATVAIVITDNAIEDWDRALATITSVELLGDASRHTIFTGEKTVDLLQLRDFVEVFAVDDNVPPGSYSKVRLRVTQILLQKLNADGSVAEELESKLVANGKIDLNPRGSFDIAGGSVLVITLDFDAHKSFKVTRTGNKDKLIVRPVIFVAIDVKPAFRDLTRLRGTIEAIDDAGFLLCEIELISGQLPDSGSTGGSAGDGTDGDGASNNEGLDDCFRIVLDDSTGIFGADGRPIDATELTEDTLATVIGQLRVIEPGDVPPADGSDGGSDGDGSSGSGDPVFALRAFTVEAGPDWQRIKGSVASTVAAERFDLQRTTTDPGVLLPQVLTPVQLFPKTRIFSPRGIELDTTNLQIGRPVIVDGVVVAAAASDLPDEINAAFIVAGDDANETAISGTLQSIEGSQLIVSTAGGDRCVSADGATILLVSDSGDGMESTEIAIGELVPGQVLELFGSEDLGGCFAADKVLASNP